MVWAILHYLQVIFFVKHIRRYLGYQFPMSVDQDQLASERPADQVPHCKVQELT